MLVIDDKRLIYGVRTAGDGAVTRLRWEDVDAALAAPDGFVWLHLDASDSRVQQWLATCELLPEDAREILLGSDRHIRIEAGPHGVMGVLGDLHHDFADDPNRIGALRLFFDDRRFVTARRNALRAVDRLRRSVELDRCERRPAPLLVELLHHLSDAFSGTLLETIEELDDVEADVLADRVKDGGAALGRARRTFAHLRRHLGPQRIALAGLLARLPAWASAEDASDLRDAVTRLDAVGHDLELAQERARQLQDERAGRLAEITNRNLYVLSIFTAMFLPMTLVTGVFGMNVGGLPGVGSAHGFIWTMALMAATGAGTFAVLKWARII
ncbi:CorA family divalent cation transporter [Methylopila henanensis]|uniref:CorA family divalent cation transporter n=1 Tax=Methylopila henanensis TaxID=873516 RepID=A0ABW4K933_9HYPH